MAFKWEPYFETGIALVDAQHRGLVELVNQVAPLLGSGQPIAAGVLDPLLDRLFAYAATHFADEEALMEAHRLDGGYAEAHQAGHARFVTTLEELRHESGGDGADSGAVLLRFLTGWLTFHILDEDQCMARQIHFVAEGVAPAEAARRAAASPPDDQARTALVGALVDLYSVLGDRNRTLRAMNERLRAAQRELEEANRTLESRVTEAVDKVERTQGQLLQSEKMAAIGQLAAGVAHEINNPVGFVNSNLGSLRKYVGQLLELVAAYEDLEARVEPGDPALRRVGELRQRFDLPFLREDVIALLEESTHGLGRVTRIVQDLKDFSHVDNQAEWQEANLLAGLESTLNVVWNEIKYKAEVKRDFAELPRVRCIPSQINQVFMNLLVNAAQAIERQGEIRLSAGSDEAWVWVDIGDTGKGIDEATQKRIFEPFFTTKPVGKGTGLGLSIAWDIIVKKHHGRIELDSRVGEGSRFRVMLPRSGGGAQAS